MPKLKSLSAALFALFAVSSSSLVAAHAADGATLKIRLIDDDLVVVSGRAFEPKTTGTVDAVGVLGSGRASITTTNTGRFLVGITLPTGFSGELKVQASVGGETRSASMSFEGSTPTTTIAPSTTTSIVALPTTTSTSVVSAPPVIEDPSPTPMPSNPSSGDWLSGATGEGALDGTFAAWRGSKVEISSTWADVNEQNQRDVPTLWTKYKDWDGPIDIGVGGLLAGESWSAASNGAYDARWRASLNRIKQERAGEGATYIRFAHEMNGSWYPWKVNAGNVADFKKSWIRYRALQQEIFPEGQLTFSVNRESFEAGMDWRQMFPGSQYVDMMSVDYYNQYPHATSQQSFDAYLGTSDKWGGPMGLDGHLAFAKSVGLAVGISEWSGNADGGDQPAFMTAMYNYIKKNSGTGPGQIAYEVVFNIDREERRFVLWPMTRQPNAAETYRNLF